MAPAHRKRRLLEQGSPTRMETYQGPRFHLVRLCVCLKHHIATTVPEFHTRGQSVLAEFGQVPTLSGPQFPRWQIRGPEKAVRMFQPTLNVGFD